MGGCFAGKWEVPNFPIFFWGVKFPNIFRAGSFLDGKSVIPVEKYHLLPVRKMGLPPFSTRNEGGGPLCTQ